MLSASFVGGLKGNLFQLIYAPNMDRSCTRAVLFLPAFAEEMNKSRRMYALLAEALSAQGVLCLIPDYYGTGDSKGDFSDADLATWQHDLTQSLLWLKGQGIQKITLLAHRSGALLVPALVESDGPVHQIIFWHPVISGNQFLNQFLRLRLATNLYGSGNKETTGELRQQLESGTSIEVAGYEISPSLARQLDENSLNNWLPPAHLKLYWFEMAGEAGRPLLPISRKLLDAWSDKGVNVDAQVIQGSAFWATQEISQSEKLIRKTLEAVQEMTA